MQIVSHKLNVIKRRQNVSTASLKNLMRIPSDKNTTTKSFFLTTKDHCLKILVRNYQKQILMCLQLAQQNLRPNFGSNTNLFLIISQITHLPNQLTSFRQLLPTNFQYITHFGIFINHNYTFLFPSQSSRSIRNSECKKQAQIFFDESRLILAAILVTYGRLASHAERSPWPTWIHLFAHFLPDNFD